MPRARLSSKGQIAIPSEIRRQLNLRRGTEFAITVEDGDVVLRKLVSVDWRRWEGAIGNLDFQSARAAERRAELDRDARRRS